MKVVFLNINYGRDFIEEKKGNHGRDLTGKNENHERHLTEGKRK